MTMNKTAIALIALTVGTALTTGCGKYEDGPDFSLRSRKERIANTWQVEKATDGGNDVTSSFDQYELQMLRDGAATLAALYHIGDLSFEFQTNGTWDLVNKDEDLQLDFENNAADETWEILRLKEKELWLHEKDGDLELHLIPL
jgi:hypothetical protein